MMIDAPGKRQGPCVKMLTRVGSWPQYQTGSLSETYQYLVHSGSVKWAIPSLVFFVFLGNSGDIFRLNG